MTAPAHGTHSLYADLSGLLEERDRLTTLLDISRAAASLDLPRLIHRVATCLQNGRERWDHFSLCLYDSVQKVLRAHLFFSAPGPLEESHDASSCRLIPIEGTQSGRAFVSGVPCVVNSRADYEQLAPRSSPYLSLLPSHYSSCVVPLVCCGHRIGTLASACAREDAFDAPAVQLLSQIADLIAPAVDNALAYQRIEELTDRLAKQKSYLESEVSASVGELVGDSPALRQLLFLLESVARTDSTVLVCGETGTGKELVARAIHRLGGRQGGTFVKLNCAAIPTGLLESELFGHERGAFTGAVGQKIGRFELASSGTLFLDEIGDIPVDLQPKLLRVLQEQEFERLGGTRTIKADVRVIAATNRDLPRMMEEGTFRSDLYYRLNVFPIVVPPLRERREDIPRLVRHFLDRSARRLKRPLEDVSSDTLELLCAYDWPGNVRELENVIERAAILSPAPVLRLGPTDLGSGGGNKSPGPAIIVRSAGSTQKPQRLADAERLFIIRALEESSWVVGGRAGAAERLGLSRTTLQARMRKLGIVRPR